MHSVSVFPSTPKKARSAMIVLAVAGACVSIAWAQNQQPGAAPGSPAPGQPDFIMPQPNRGDEPDDKPKPRAPKPVEPAKPEQPGAETKPAAPKAAETQPVAPQDGADTEKPSYLIGAFVLRYAADHPALPSLDDLQKRQVVLGRTADGFVAPGGGVEEVTITVEDVALQAPQRWTSRAIHQVAKAILAEMNSRGVVGVTVAPIESEFGPPEEADPDWGKDLRKPGQSAVTLLVTTGIVTEMRTLAFGERIPDERRINATEHEKILLNSPVKIYTPDTMGERSDILRKDLLDDYVYRLNRHPGRRVDTAVSAAQAEGGIALDLLINESKPWLVYLQGSNTGTDETSEWRQRLGFVHNQITGNDDILSIDFITSLFDESNTLIGSYERPIWGDWLRGRVFANWSEYTASDVGLDGQDFDGESFTIGGELIANIYQYKELFVDAYAGLRYEHIEVNNRLLDQNGSEPFLLPSVGLRLERTTETSVTNASIGLEWNLASLAGTDDDDIDLLGRLNTDADWTVFVWDFAHSFYLDQYIYGDRWSDTGPEGNPTLAHEIAVSLRGQYAFDNRLAPNFEQVVGGLYTVRGYTESSSAGDTVVVGSLEYRFHVPQALGFDPNPGTMFGQTFRYKPQQPYGRADWDLVLKGFLDVGTTLNSHRESYETDDDLIGAGFGIDFLYKRNLNLRLDFGWALEETAEVDAGNFEVHFVGTLLF